MRTQADPAAELERRAPAPPTVRDIAVIGGEQERPVAHIHFTAPGKSDDLDHTPISGFAITSFVAAFFIPVVAVVFGHLAIRHTRSGRYAGRKMAIAGVILGWIGIVWVGLMALALALGVMVVTAGGKIIIG
ncbi:DUF4190 domain-containing protein [Agromyces sp. NPDC057679]|uniref:DUF4190 domain-containing protein n=1 Tax=Agromyces sp. NPDC057679 TaxID=3346207 RepID=UPI00366E076C